MRGRFVYGHWTFSLEHHIPLTLKPNDLIFLKDLLMALTNKERSDP
jgi:hypothetical protein